MSKRREGGISIIAWYALIGVVLGVATLVIVQAVMIGFRTEFVEKIVGANSHLAIYKKTLSTDLDDGFYVEEVQSIMQDLKNKKNFKAAYTLVCLYLHPRFLWVSYFLPCLLALYNHCHCHERHQILCRHPPSS